MSQLGSIPEPAACWAIEETFFVGLLLRHLLCKSGLYLVQAQPCTSD